jgi:hypothetical protein
MVDATKYPLLAATFEKVLSGQNWGAAFEFKGKTVFSSRSGDLTVSVERRIEMVTKIFNEFRPQRNSRIGAAVLAWNNAGAIPQRTINIFSATPSGCRSYLRIVERTSSWSSATSGRRLSSTTSAQRFARL